MGHVRQTKHSADTYWSDLLYHAVVESSGDLPTVTTDDITFGYTSNAIVDGTVVSQGGSDLTSYGFVWSTSSGPTLDDNVVEVGTGSFTGEFENNVHSLPFPGTIYFKAYATNSSGTSYGSELSGETNICLAAGTLIGTPEGVRKIEEITYNDAVLCWNFDDGVFAAAKPVWIVRPFTSEHYAYVKFSDGSELRTVPDGKGHRIFNLEKGEFTHLMKDDDTPIGTTTITDQNKLIRVVSKGIVKAETTFHNIIANTHINVYANGILTSTGLNNLYPVTNMKFVKDDRQLRSHSEFRVSEEMFSGLRLAEQPQSADLSRKLKRMTRRQLHHVEF